MHKVRLGFIGCGWWATFNHLPLLKNRTDVELVSACGLDESVLARVGDCFGIQHTTTDYRELLGQDLDGVIVSSPHSLHYEHTEAALKRGLHVMCEKPMTLRASEAWDLVELARRNKRILLVPYGWHYKPWLKTAKEWILEGALGEVEYLMCHMASPTKQLFSGDRSVPSSFTPTIAQPDFSTWQVKSLGGGYAHGQFTHSAALMFWLTGLSAQEVTCQTASLQSGVDMYDAAIVRFATGALASLSGAATLPQEDKFQIDLRIFGKKGVLLLDMERERIELRLHEGAHRSVNVPAGSGAYSCEHPPNAFVDLILGRGENYSPGEVAAKSVELVEAMYRSAETHAPVVIERK